MKCGADCTKFTKKKKFYASWWVALTVFICFLVIGSPFLFWLTHNLKFGTAVVCPRGPFKLGPSWWGWILHSIVAGFLGLGLGYAFMKPGEPEKCCCPA